MCASHVKWNTSHHCDHREQHHYAKHNGIRILGTSAEGIDIAEDRERFDSLLEKLSIKRPRGESVMTTQERISR